MTNFIYFPRSHKIPEIGEKVVRIFESHTKEILKRYSKLESNEVLKILHDDLINIGFDVESSKKAIDKIKVPVLYGLNNSIDKYFEADAWHKNERMVLEVEAGRGYVNNQFLKDLFQACMMHEIDYCTIAIRNTYRKSNDFEKVRSFFETLYASNRIALPLKGVLIIGY